MCQRYWAKITVSPGPHPSGGSRGICSPTFFLETRAPCLPQLLDPSSMFTPASAFLLHVTLFSGLHGQISSAFFLQGLLCLHAGPTGIARDSLAVRGL